MQGDGSSRPIAVSLPWWISRILAALGILPRDISAREVCITENKSHLLLAYITGRYIVKCALQLASANKVRKLATSVQTISRRHVASTRNTTRVRFFGVGGKNRSDSRGAKTNRYYKFLLTREFISQRCILKERILWHFLLIYVAHIGPYKLSRKTYFFKHVLLLDVQKNL